jgi:hypothetical protein
LILTAVLWRAINKVLIEFKCGKRTVEQKKNTTKSCVPTGH